MVCDTRLKPRQTISERADEVRKAQTRFNAGLTSGSIKAIVSKQGAVAFTGISDMDRDGVTDGCALRRIMSTGSITAKLAIARAEQIAGRKIDMQVVGQGLHSHDGGNTWHSHKK